MDCLKCFVIYALFLFALNFETIAYCQNEKPILVLFPPQNDDNLLLQNVKNLFEQHYTNFRVIYFDHIAEERSRTMVTSFLQEKQIDYQSLQFNETLYKSPKKAQAAFRNLVSNAAKFTIVSSTSQINALCAIYRATQSAQNEEIIFLADDRDCFSDNEALQDINQAYATPQVFYTYEKSAYKEHASFTRQSDHSTVSKVRSFYTWLFKKIALDDLLYDKQFIDPYSIALKYFLTKVQGPGHGCLSSTSIYPACILDLDVEKPIVVVIPSRNNEKWVKKNLTKLFEQQYTNYRVIYLNDASTDSTSQRVLELVQAYNIAYAAVDFDASHEEAQTHFNELVHAHPVKFLLVTNHQRIGGLGNIYRAVHTAQDQEIIVTYDGDDWLYHPHVLAELNQDYTLNDIWYTHGTLIEYPHDNVSWSEPLSPETIANHSYRLQKCPSHLRTFYAWLFKKISLDDLLYENGFFPMAGDMAMMYPMAEMAGPRHAFISNVSYVYNMATPFNDNKVNPDLQNHLDALIRAKTPYQRIE